jgi:hypothetical protein
MLSVIDCVKSKRCVQLSVMYCSTGNLSCFEILSFIDCATCTHCILLWNMVIQCCFELLSYCDFIISTCRMNFAVFRLIMLESKSLSNPPLFCPLFPWPSSLCVMMNVVIMWCGKHKSHQPQLFNVTLFISNGYEPLTSYIESKRTSRGHCTLLNLMPPTCQWHIHGCMIVSDHKHFPPWLTALCATHGSTGRNFS